MQPPQPRFDWDDVRIFLAVVEHGSTMRAANALQIDQTTCARRIAALEAALELQLFAREGGRYRANPDAGALAALAKPMGEAAARFAEAAQGLARAKARRFRLTTEETLARLVVAPVVAKMAATHPEVEFVIDTTSTYRDLAGGEADIAVRGGLPPGDPSLIRRKLAEDPMGIYCEAGYHSPPKSPAEIAGHDIAVHEGLLAATKQAGLGNNVRHVANAMSTLRAIIATGGVIGALPASIAHGEPPLHHCFEVTRETGIWMIFPDRLGRPPILRKLGDLLAKHLAQLRLGERA